MSQKIYNFLDFRLKPEVTCDVPFSDDHGPEMLISECPKEFMAYNVVKPPAVLKFKFICKIELDCIKIHTKVGSLKSTHIEISTEEFGRVADGTCEKPKDDGVCFIRNNLRNGEFLQGTDKLNHSKFFRTLRPTRELTVTIKRTMRCPPVLRKIEVWGRLARDCTINELEMVEKLWNVSNIDEPTASKVPSPSEVIEEFTIPEEFLDQITFQLMSIPMTLPSGKIIDESTLEKCQKLDYESGRAPCDPFTGQPFTLQRKPLFNSGLKARIDKFLMTHADKSLVRDAPRTVGTYVRRDFVPRKTLQGNPLSRLEFTEQMSFEDKLAAALAAIRQNNSSELKLIDKRCSKCESEQLLYKIKICGHLICRKCLLGIKEGRLMCKSCSKFFKRSDVEKYHEVVR